MAVFVLFSIVDQIGWMINGLLGRRAKSNVDLVAHPGILGDSLELLAGTYKDRYLVGFSHLPECVSEIIIFERESDFIFHGFADSPEARCFDVALFVPDQGGRGHSGVNPLELARPRLLLRRRPGQKKIFHTFDREQFGIVKVANHPVVGEIFK